MHGWLVGSTCEQVCSHRHWIVSARWQKLKHAPSVRRRLLGEEADTRNSGVKGSSDCKLSDWEYNEYSILP